ncbi:tryptophan-rich sensory protein [Martelella lutilitoris]|uniref:Tryptophan-rich sensory protein n=1 Tax=Martelella lutilitoris TaxID=2583532 RepID=A0A7T7HIF4_9HYPH|nr:TspO/MBR family protein [Martelella lutilitoris]QQM29699.1 tryptophan-rich sensory protein [Martelella lutilitoris]
MKNILIHAVFIVGVVIAGFIVGIVNVPGEWYQSLAKPPFNPPNWVFAPAWSLLYVLIGWAGARLFIARPQTSGALTLWSALLVLNLAWSPLFFGMEMPAAALVVVVALLAGILLFIARTWGKDRPSAVLFVPYAAWVAFATLLNASIVYLN